MELDQAQFDRLSTNLRSVVHRIPPEWGHIQNNVYDKALERVCNIFDIIELSEFERYISGFDDDHKKYYLRRWFVLRCADCDEFLFYKHEGVEHNPNPYDKKWDIRINNSILFDVKGTIIPRCFRHYFEPVLNNPQGIVEFYYDYQSSGVRFDMQNRLFIVHHSLVADNRESKLRCGWGSKDYVYSRFLQEINNVRFISYRGQTAGVIFLIETEPGILRYLISGLDTELQSIPQ